MKKTFLILLLGSALSLSAQSTGQFSNGKTADGANGIQITDIANGSPAAQLGLEKGDVIIGIGRTRVNNIAELRAVLDKAKGVIAIQLQRGDAVFYTLIR